MGLLVAHQFFLGSAYLIGTYWHVHVQILQYHQSIKLAVLCQTKLSLIFLWALTYCFGVFLDLETIVLMATIPATRA